MKKTRFAGFYRVLSVALAFFAVIGVWAKTEIKLEKAGTLPIILTQTDSELKVSGPINGTDIKHIRQLVLDGKVRMLDISEANIVSGGVAYFEDYKTEKDVIGNGMFKDCFSLRAITLPSTIVAIETNAFSGTGLVKIDIPNSVARLGYDSFAYCSKLSTVIIGRRVSNMDQGIFYQSPVKTVYAKPTTPPATPPYLFTSNPRIRVYTSSLNDYKESGWKNFGTISGGLESVYPEEADSSEIVNNLCGTYFEDFACTQLKAEYQTMTDEELSAAMTEGGMPSFMTEIAIKLKNEKWALYEKEFRIHSYKAYSDANYWNNRMRSSGGSYMGNPTGIYARDYSSLYVFVDSDIPEDATLYLAGCTGNNLVTNAKTGKKLKKGLNIVDATKDALYYVIYTANTESQTKTLSEWPEMKIHIQGGVVNGYYDVAHHTDRDYQILLRKATHDLFTVKGKESLFNFKRSAYKEIWPSTIERSICWFDSIAVWQKELMGMSAHVAAGQRAQAPHCLTGGESVFPIYYNNPNFAIQGKEEDAGWANSSSYRTSYNSVGCIRASFLVTSHDHDDWCAGHECGHNNQGTISLEGGTEVSNNLFSNVGRFLTGAVTSSGEALSTTMYEYAHKLPYLRRGGLMRMYYQLYLYYHQGQRNTSFYPNLFKALRNDPMVLWQKDSNSSSLKFVRKACEVAQEDLTDFFAAWGFFEPFNNITVNDYGTNTMTVHLADINRTLAEIAKYPRKNREILFVEDRVDYVLNNGLFTTAGKKRRDSHLVGQCGNLGQFTDFIPGATVEPSSYTYLQSDSFYVMSGTGGVGFVMLGADEKLRYASNSFKFCIPSCVEKDFTIYSVDADGSLHVAVQGGSGTEIVNLTKTGTLQDSLSAQAIKAIISGGINGTDIRYMRKLINEDNLQAVDLSGVRFVSGGLPYYESYKAISNVVGNNAFYNCKNLIAMNLPKTIIRIESNAFANSGIREIVIPENVTSVGMDAFAYCPNLNKVVIGSKVKNMAQGVFYNSAVKEAFVLAKTPPTIATYLFTSKPIIHVYASSLAAYQASAWADLGTLVGDLDDYGNITSVQLPEANADDKNAPVYDLNGRRVNRLLPSTIYIRNGKKFMTAP